MPVAAASSVPYWLDSTSAPSSCPRLIGHADTDLAVVGGGFSGLWTALLAKEADPTREVLLVEAATVGWAASGRNGGFVVPSLTHGLANGVSRWPDEVDRLEQLGVENLDAFEKALARHDIDASFERTGELTVATEPWQVDDLRARVELARRHGGEPPQWLDADAVRERINSPRFLAGAFDPSTALVDPARLAWGLLDACRRLGVRVHENSPVRSVDDEGATVLLRSDGGSMRARRVALCTNAFPNLVKRVRPYVVPVYDYVLMTQPVSAEQRAVLGWSGREGLTDAGNQFHYARCSDDGRLLWGGYDAIYHYGSAIRPDLDQRPETFDLLYRHLTETFPVLEGIGISHRWGGVVDTCTRFSPFWGRGLGGKAAYVLGYTGLGVATSRFGARVLLDLLAGADTERTRLAMVRRRPFPFPPEPARAVAIAVTRRSIARADARGGRRDLWLRTLDRLGLGFDS